MYRELKLKNGRERSVLNMHPWIFSGALTKIPEYTNGEIVKVISSQGVTLGYGFYSAASQIICRVFEFTGQNILFFDYDYFRRKIRTALDLRNRIIPDKTDCFRLINAEGDFFPGLTVDIFGSIAVLQVQVRGTESLLDIISDELADIGYKDICIKNPGANETEGVDIPFGFIRGGCDTSAVVNENGLRFRVDIENGQKTGFFLDQRENRMLVKNYSKGRRVLNAFSYTGGFSVYAIAGGAELVHSVDISSDAVNSASGNVELNFGKVEAHTAIKSDCFEYLRAMDRGRYDLIVLDPPAFVKSSKGVERGARGYKEINLSAMRKAAKDSLLFTFSCSHHVDSSLFRKIVFSAAADSGRRVRVLAQLSQGIDHPFSIYHPEGEYLKGLLLHIE